MTGSGIMKLKLSWGFAEKESENSMHYLGQDNTSQISDTEILEEVEDLSVKHGIRTGIHDGISDLTKYIILGGAILLVSTTIWPKMGTRLKKRFL